MEGKRRSVVPGMHWSGCTKCYLQLHRWLRFGVDQKMKGTIDKQSIVIGLLLRNTMSPCDVSEVITTSISPSWTKAVRTNSFCSGWSQRVFVSQNKILQRAGMGEMMRNVLNSYTSERVGSKAISSYFHWRSSFHRNSFGPKSENIYRPLLFDWSFNLCNSIDPWHQLKLEAWCLVSSLPQTSLLGCLCYMQVPWDVQIVMDHVTSNLRLHEKSRTSHSLKQKEFDTYGTEWTNLEVNFMHIDRVYQFIIEKNMHSTPSPRWSK